MNYEPATERLRVTPSLLKKLNKGAKGYARVSDYIEFIDKFYKDNKDQVKHKHLYGKW